VFEAMFAASSDPPAYQFAVSSSGIFLDNEAFAFSGDTTLGWPWVPGTQHDSIADANVSAVKQSGKPLSLAVGAAATPPEQVHAYADGIYELTMKSPVTELKVLAGASGGATGGNVRLRSTKGPELNEPHVTDLTLCEPGKQCGCPGAKQFKRGDLAIAAGTANVTFQLTAGCILPLRSCLGMLPPSDFPSQTGEEPGPSGGE
jgi:hypothetical protein